ncbi:hypothetical protein D3C87_1322980 [compost metagenome]
MQKFTLQSHGSYLQKPGERFYEARPGFSNLAENSELSIGAEWSEPGNFQPVFLSCVQLAGARIAETVENLLAEMEIQTCRLRVADALERIPGTGWENPDVGRGEQLTQLTDMLRPGPRPCFTNRVVSKPSRSETVGNHCVNRPRDRDDGYFRRTCGKRNISGFPVVAFPGYTV